MKIASEKRVGMCRLQYQGHIPTTQRSAYGRIHLTQMHAHLQLITLTYKNHFLDCRYISESMKGNYD